jgi:hypothetical protein
MGGQKIGANYATIIGQILVILSIAGAILLPPIELNPNYPKIEISDVTFPILALLLALFCRTTFLEKLIAHRKIVMAFAVFVGIVVFSILLNGRVTQVRDWFEVLKYVKFIFFIFVIYTFFSKSQIYRFMTPLLLAVFAFNLLHYFNVLDFNRLIEPYYAAPHHLDFFGLNSIGEPATKRALGTLGNPNTNGLLFLMFVLLFLPRVKAPNRVHLMLLALAIIGVFLCQSRTGLLAYALILLAYYITNPSHWKMVVAMIVFSFLIYGILALMGNLYLSSLGNVELMKSAGVGRLEQWKKIWASMPGHWFIGHAPEKEYFEKHGIYSESEYFLVLFRYGFVGLVAFIAFWGMWAKEYVLQFKNGFKLGLFVLIVYMFSAITNNPLQSPKIALILGLLMALTLIEIDEKQEQT